VGEARAAAPLARALQRQRAGLSLLVTTSTATGRACAAREIEAHARMAPWDAPGPLGRFLRAVRPSLHVSVETEIWPLRLRRLERLGVPRGLVSARISERAAPHYSRAGSLYRPALAGLTLVAPAGEADRDRLLALGVRPEALGPMGSLKWDACPQPPDETAIREVRGRLGLGGHRSWVVLGSVHLGEAGPLLDHLAHAVDPATRWGAVVAPRHPARFDQVWEEIRSTGLAAHRASDGPAPADVSVVLLDTLGMLPKLYPLATAAFVGGSLVPVGGHSPLEAAACGVPIAHGPHDQQQSELLASLASAGAAARGAGAEEVARTLGRWLDDPTEARRSGSRGRAEVDRHRGLSEQLAARLLELLP
jgi:3-deoxy-D-manno-octulosonic-acid transferase